MATAKRLAGMRPHEVTTRLRQAARGLGDDWRHGLGLQPRQPVRGTERSRGRFFFDPADAPALAREWAERSPEAVAGVLARAEKIAAHKFSLLGYADLDFGTPIDWHLDPVHSVRAPRVPWRRVPYLDFRAVGDHKIIWELSRHQHLTTLARASLYSGDSRWAEEAIRQWRDWRKQNPYPVGINWASALEVAFRLLSWTWIDHLLGADDTYAEFRNELTSAIGHSAWYIERYLSTYFAPNTHLLGEGVALLFVGLLYRDFRDAARWRELGWSIVLDQARAQVREDGFHFEQSTYYHVYALDFFLHARILVARNGESSADLDAVIERMAAALHGISQTGTLPRFGDDDGGRVFDPSRNRDAGLLDPLAVSAALFDRGEFKTGEFTEEAWWLFGPAGAAHFDPLVAPVDLETRAFRSSGYFAMAGQGSLLVADAGPHGFGRGGHGHADALSVQISAGARALLSDPGTGAYPVETLIRNRLRGTAAHSTLQVDGLDQAQPEGPFAWSTQPVSRPERWRAGRALDLFRASHDGYARLADPLLHQRWIVGWKPGGWLVRDLAISGGRTPGNTFDRPAHGFDLRWRLAPEAARLDPTPESPEFSFRFPDGEAITIAPEEATGWEPHLEESEFSPVYGAVVEAPVVRLSYQGAAPVAIATILATGSHQRSTRLRRWAQSSIYEWSDADGSRYAWFAEADPVREAAGWRTDADFVFVALDAARTVVCFVLMGGTFLEAGEQPVYRSESRVEVIEWLPGDRVPASINWNLGAFRVPSSQG